MGRIELHKVSFLSNGNDDSEKELYLKELSDSVHNYIRIGVKSKQLDDLIELEEEFQNRYEERFDIRRVVDTICEASEKILLEVGKRLFLPTKDTEDIKSPQEKNDSLSLEKTAGQIREIVDEVVSMQLSEVIKDTAYLSHMNMLYELFEKEEKLRREEKEYQRISEKFKQLGEISERLNKHRRMDLEELQKQMEISEIDMESVIIGCEKYFNIRRGNGTILISLSPAGRKYSEYLSSGNVRYSYETLNQLIYKNCSALLESLENSCDRGLEYELRLEEVAPDKERALKSKYDRIVEKVILENEENYSNLRKKKESVMKNNEKNRIRLPREWGKEIY